VVTRPLTPQQRAALAEADRDPWLLPVLALGFSAGWLLTAIFPWGW
jgi:hypothetical protein